MERLNLITKYENINLDSLGLTKEQQIGIHRPLPNLNVSIDFSKLNRAIQHYKSKPWYYFSKYKIIKRLEKFKEENKQ